MNKGVDAPPLLVYWPVSCYLSQALDTVPGDTVIL